jgi:AcrR family transcriptional regulator
MPENRPMSPTQDAAPRPRDRDATAKSLLAAALRLLAREGFTALGPNAVAAEAGCDKKLIYRYFGGMDGLVEALGGELALWLGGAAQAVPEGADYAGRIAALLEGYAEGLRGDVALQRALAWELAEGSEPLRRLDAVRGAAFGQWTAAALAGATRPEGVDAPAINAVLLGALHYLTLRARTLGGFAGVELATPEGRARIDAALRFLMERAYAAPKPPSEAGQ